MIGFRDAPEDPHRVITPSDRHDEVGVAEQALAEMQQELRAALLQKGRLAGVGTAVTKISHDLRNILATAMLESDRLAHRPRTPARAGGRRGARKHRAARGVLCRAASGTKRAVMDTSELLGVVVLVAAIGVIMWHYRSRN